jgi:prophage regulatory protein
VFLDDLRLADDENAGYFGVVFAAAQHINAKAGVSSMLNAIDRMHMSGATNAVPQFPNSGLVRLKSIIAPGGPLPISKSSWWAGVRDGRYPRPRKISPRVTVWLAEDIRLLLAKIEQEEV